MKNEKKIAIVGAGPNCTYALDLLLRRFYGKSLDVPLTILIFESTKEFGGGKTHSAATPKNILLNRVAGQISLGAGEMYKPEVMEQFGEYSPTFLDWAKRKFNQTGDSVYKFAPTDWPARCILGEAMSDAFAFCIKELNKINSINIHLHNKEVINVIKDREDDSYNIVTAKKTFNNITNILFVTGASERSISKNSWIASIEEKCKIASCRFIKDSYPLEENLNELFNSNQVFLIGTGTTAVDVISHLHRTQSENSHEMSQLRVFPMGRSGSFCWSRALNQKNAQKDNFHKGYVFNKNLVDRLRNRANQKFGTRKIFFEIEILPILVAEMVIIFYGTFFGNIYIEYASKILKKRIHEYLERDKNFVNFTEAKEFFTEKISDKGESLLLEVDEFISSNRHKTLPPPDSFWNYSKTVCPGIYNEINQNCNQEDVVAKIISEIMTFNETSLYFKNPLDNKFDWGYLKNPIQKNSIKNAEDLKFKLIKFMKKDIARSKQGNINNPLKAACDGVWRDLRPVISYAVGKGGVRGDCLKILFKHYLPLHNRIGDGPSIEVMENILNYLENGFIQVDYFFDSKIELDEENKKLYIKGGFGKTVAKCIILGMLDLHKTSYKNNTLYKNILEGGLVTMWNINADEADNSDSQFLGLNLNDSFHPINRESKVDERLTFLGPPCEGYHFFQYTLARPDQNQPAITNLMGWMNEIF